MAPDQHHMVGLPLSVVGPVDLGRLIRELESLENVLLESQLRTPDQEAKVPKTSHAMEEILGLNKLDLLKEDDRRSLKQFLTTVRAKAPRLHMSFSADPSPAFINKIMTWLRDNVHPVVLLTVGMQPGIGAGCIIRTPNKYFDLSLGKDIAKKREVLMATLREMPQTAPAQAQPAQPAPAPAQPAAPARSAADHAAAQHSRTMASPPRQGASA